MRNILRFERKSEFLARLIHFLLCVRNFIWWLRICFYFSLIWWLRSLFYFNLNMRPWAFQLLISVLTPHIGKHALSTFSQISMVSCQKGPTRHAYAWQIGPFWQDTPDVRRHWTAVSYMKQRAWRSMIWRLIYRGFSARLQYLQCVSNGDTAVLHWAIDISMISIIFLPNVLNLCYPSPLETESVFSCNIYGAL